MVAATHAAASSVVAVLGKMRDKKNTAPPRVTAIFEDPWTVLKTTRHPSSMPASTSQRRRAGATKALAASSAGNSPLVNAVAPKLSTNASHRHGSRHGLISEGKPG